MIFYLIKSLIIIICFCINRYCLAVIHNVAKHAQLANFVAKAENAADTLIDLMQMFRDKKSIFCQSCEILCNLIAADEEMQV